MIEVSLLKTMLRASFSRTLTGAARRYSTAPPPPPPAAKKSNNTLVALGAGAAAAGLGYYFFSTSGKSLALTSGIVKPKQEKSPLDPQQFINFKLKQVIPYNHNTSTFVFELPDGESSLLPVASCVVVKAADPDALNDAKGKPIIRPYTPTSHPDLPGELHLLIKKYENGNASKHIHSLKEGEDLAIKGPIAKFPYTINQFEEVALIGGGSGITPLYQILDYALPDPSNKTKFKLIFANVTEKDILLRERFDEWKKQYPDKFDVVYVLENVDKAWKGEVGYVTKDVLKKHVAPASVGDKVKVFICGPPAQVAAVAGKKEGMKQGEVGGILKELGYTTEQVGVIVTNSEPLVDPTQVFKF
ncbi:cytochrome-b5 reductase [Hysterangium stoloniferum]|nr:cytochrome-b5 reductase [Hysterangium stoloniferum]